MTVSLADVEKGRRFAPVSFDLSSEWVSQYIAAVGDEAIGRLGADVVPPMGVAALAIRSLLEHWSLPPGTLHAGQELTFMRALRTGESLRASGTVLSRGERGGWVLMTVLLEVADSAGEPVMTGRATVSFPADGGV